MIDRILPFKNDPAAMLSPEAKALVPDPVRLMGCA